MSERVMVDGAVADAGTRTRQQKRELVARLLAERTRRAGPERSPLSYGQQSMWFMHRLAPEATAYNLGEALRLDGPLDLDALRRAVTALAGRHRVLCSRIVMDDDGAVWQELLDPEQLRLEEVDVAGWTEDRLVDALAAEVERPFDLGTGPLLRLVVHRLGAEQHVVLLVLHHVVGEFWTLVLLIRDLVALYESQRSGTPVALPVVTQTYGDFARHQREQLDGVEGDRLWQYWSSALTPEPAPLRLPTDRPRPALRSFRGALHGFELGGELADALTACTRRTGATAYQVTLAAFQVFLHRHSGQTDIVVGTPMTGRMDAQWADVVGYFDNPLPLRLQLDGSLTFDQVVARTRTAVLGAFAHQAMPFPLLVERLRPRPEAGRSPLFDVMFVFRRSQSAEHRELAAMAMGGGGASLSLAEGLRATSLELPRRASQLDLTLSLAQTAQGLHGSWEYDAELFDEPTVRRFSERYCTLLSALLACPGAPVETLDVVGEQELAEQHGWNDTAAPVPEDPRIHAGFLSAVTERPAATAVVDGPVRLTFGELDRISDELATRLQQSGARPGVLVAVCMRKGWEQIAAVLGVVKSGAAYLPVDAALPPQRVDELLRLGDVSHVLAQADTARLVPARSAWPVLVVDRDLAGHARVPDAWQPEPHHLAYVIFTSGSTGTPKGVVIEHAAVTNTLADVNDRFGVGPADVVLGLSSLSFDLSVWDVFGVLGVGGTLVLPSAEELRDPSAWARLVRAEGVTVWNTVPALAQLLAEEVEADGPAALPSLRLAMLSGDWLPLPLPDRLRASSPQVAVVSLGGATEVSIWSIAFPVDEVDPAWASVPYGRPLRNQSFHVLDDGARPCPVGVAGQLHIGGVGLARGYWRDPERTAERFVDLPLQGRVYRTGDLGRYRSDGVIEFLGRQDLQVKIGGHRVEPGEIEAVILDDAQVREVVVVADRVVGGGGRLVAYVVGTPSAVARVQEQCRSRLPAYMVPSVVVPLAALPLSANGKVDRAALPGSERSAPDRSGEVAPRARTTAVRSERAVDVVTDVVGRLLGVPAGPDDDFFLLGGDSVTAIRLCTALRRDGLLLTPEQVFDLGGLREVADACTTTSAPPGDRAPAPPAAEVEHGLAPMQQTMLLHAVIAGSDELYCEQVSICLTGPVDVTRLRGAWQRVVDRHEALRARFRFDDAGLPRQRFATHQPVDLPVTDLSDSPEAEAKVAFAELLAQDRRTGFPHLDGPLLRLALVRFADDRSVLVWSHHHLLLDGWSLTVVLEDLARQYEHLSGPGAPGADVAAPGYSRYLHWLEDEGAVRRAEDEAFWREQLSNVHAGTRLPGADDEAPGGLPFRHAEVEVVLPEWHVAAVRTAAAAMGVTLNTVVQTAWGLLLSRWTGQEEVLLGATTAGRPAGLPDVEDVVGLFINTLPLRLVMDGSRSVRETAREVQRRQAAASAHATVGLADVERWSGCARAAGRTALFDTVLVFENYPASRAVGSALPMTDVSFSEVTGAPFMLYAIPDRDVVLRVTYDAASRSEADVLRRLEQLGTTMQALVADPDALLASVCSTPAARHAEALLDGGPVVGGLVLALLAERAREAPSSVALEQGSSRCTYGELVERSDAVGRRVAELGAGRGTHVAVLLPRVPDAVVTVLGVLASGAAYLPIDTEAAPGRTHEILLDADPVLVVTTAACAERVPVGLRSRVVVLEELVSAPSGHPSPELPAASRPDDPCYVMYTSGTTGGAKGVVVSHGALAQFVAGARSRYGVRATDRVLQFAPLSFDTSVEEVFVTLCSGATLVLRDAEPAPSPRRLLEVCARDGVTVLDLPTAYWHEVAYAVSVGATVLPDSVRLVVIGGEAASAERVRGWCRSVPPEVRLLNTYGPTEATVVATCAQLSGDRTPCDGAVPIGLPLPGVLAAVVDRHLQPVLAGAVGELVLAGGAVATGYLRRPDLEQERFVPFPAWAGGGRGYLTGDLVHRAPDGELVFVGRVDDEVKISGHRVDPSGVGAVLQRTAGVREAAVLTVDAPGLGVRLAAWVVPTGADVTVTGLRDELSAVLPGPAVPVRIELVEALPLTASGKVDRAALRTRAALPSPVPPPAQMSDVEELVARVWSAVLGVVEVLPSDDFFDLGGQSLQTIQVANRLGVELGRDVPVALLYHHSTLAALADALAAELGRPADSPLR